MFSVDEIHELIKRGETVYWENDSYKFYREPVNCAYQASHFSTREGYVLSIRCISNYFGGVADATELSGAWVLTERGMA